MSGIDCEPLLNSYGRLFIDYYSDKQHTAITLGLGGLYPEAANIPAILQPQQGETKKILDLGRSSAHLQLQLLNIL